jgi:hypothetical protein
MTTQDIINEVRLELTGGVLKLEITDAQIEEQIKRALRKVERWYSETTFATIPFASCINLAGSDLDGDKVRTIVKVYRAKPAGATSSEAGYADPLYAQQWMIFSNGGTMYNLQDYVSNYASYLLLRQIKNTLSTDMKFIYDKHKNLLYINNALSSPDAITIEYIPKLTSVEDIHDEDWIDNLVKYSIAYCKIAVGTIRSRFTLANSPISQNGESLKSEGYEELKTLDDKLQANDNYVLPID